MLAAWLALGVGHLAAGLFSAGSSPYLAVGDTVIRLLVDGVGVDLWHGVDQGRFDAGADHRGGLQGQPGLR